MMTSPSMRTRGSMSDPDSNDDGDRDMDGAPAVPARGSRRQTSAEPEDAEVQSADCAASPDDAPCADDLASPDETLPPDDTGEFMAGEEHQDEESFDDQLESEPPVHDSGEPEAEAGSEREPAGDEPYGEARPPIRSSPPWGRAARTPPTVHPMAWVFLGVLVAVVGYLVLSSFDRAMEATRVGGSATSTERGTDAGATPAKPGQTVEVVIQGLNLRTQPSIGGGVIIRKLSKGLVLDLLARKPGWLEVRAPDGTKGWVVDRQGYTRLTGE